MENVKEFTGNILKKSGRIPEEGSRLFVEHRDNADFKEEFVIKSADGFVGYPDEYSCCRLYEGVQRGQHISVEVLNIKKEGILNALFIIN